jgi:serine/threonine-protein kinase
MGVIHRDLKPENIMVREGRALVLDFGLARALDVQSNLTGSGMPLGTPAYMSPEQILGAADAGASADLYSLACVTYEMLTGRPPFVGAGVVNVLQGHLRLTPAPPSHHRREIHRGIDAAILRALAKTPEARQGSVDQFVAELAEPPADGSARPPAPPVETRPAPGLLGRLFGKR